MHRYLTALLLSSSFLVCLSWGKAWGDSDKTIVDLERGPASLAIRYSRPRGAQLYRYDKTELDVATPVTDQTSDTQVSGSSQNTVPATAPSSTRRTSRTSPLSSTR
jgi:hypothetical protein